MENVNDHSKAKLALAVFTSPGAAFEEIHRRKLLGTALLISAITGTIAVFPPLIAYFSGERFQWLVIAQYNPVAWIGLTMLYVLAMQRLLKWIGAQVDFVALLTLVGWAQLAMLVVEIARIVYSISGGSSISVASASQACIALFLLWYVILMGPAVQALIGVHKIRGVLTYVVIQLAIWIGLTWTYVNTRLSGFEGASRGVNYLVGVLAYADKLPWAAVATLGLAVGTAMIAKHFELEPARVKAYAAGAGLLGLIVFGAFAFGLYHAGYYARLGHVQQATFNGQYSEAAQYLEPLKHASKNNGALLLDLGDLYFLSNNDDRAVDRYKDAIASIGHYATFDRQMLLAQAHDGIGAIYDLQGKYPEALAEFEKASKAWPEFREPWVRKAVTYDRMGKYDKALEADNHAMKKLESEATVAWVALGEASAQTGNTAQTKTAIAIVAKRDTKLADRIGKSLENWKHAVDKLTRVDLKYPLERVPAPAPKKAAAKAKPAGKK